MELASNTMPKQLRNIMKKYSIGTIFEIENGAEKKLAKLYILVQVHSNVIQLVSLNSGDRLKDAISASDVNQIKQSTIEEMAGSMSISQVYKRDIFYSMWRGLC